MRRGFSIDSLDVQDSSPEPDRPSSAGCMDAEAPPDHTEVADSENAAAKKERIQRKIAAMKAELRRKKAAAAAQASRDCADRVATLGQVTGLVVANWNRPALADPGDASPRISQPAAPVGTDGANPCAPPTTAAPASSLPSALLPAARLPPPAHPGPAARPGQGGLGGSGFVLASLGGTQKVLVGRDPAGGSMPRLPATPTRIVTGPPLANAEDSELRADGPARTPREEEDAYGGLPSEPQTDVISTAEAAVRSEGTGLARRVRFTETPPSRGGGGGGGGENRDRVSQRGAGHP